ncbi:siderophore-interacting protein [Bogoriella caseilytica]|uniref:NADPH-dependent ferric siderophore reductase n=1 Tax=Bogoriella caseilytica TaxID=56055 RepID=A0A3N2BDU1_9MICO|nr:siderophore-interacting protein [Bogoriella caseilytica]ROR73420.1 NADPH-dependent ferric siderophore reductase [Bogoriella caseilytica]
MTRNDRPVHLHPVALRHLVVARKEDVSPAMLRLTLTGDQLSGFTREGITVGPFTSDGFDDSVKLFFSYPGETDLVLPVQKDGRLETPRHKRPLGKTYTIKRWDAEAGEIDIDFVRHETGVAATWAERCRPGDRIHMAGPARSQGIPEGADWLLLAGDETALPAIGRFLDSADGRPMQVFIEVPDRRHWQDLPEIEHAEVTWLYRGEDPPGSRLLGAVAATTWWPGTPFAWVAVESQAMRALRRHLVDERHLPKESVDAVGYWRQRVVQRHTDDSSLPAMDSSAPVPAWQLRALASLATPMAIRTAVTLRIPDVMLDGVEDAAAIARRIGAAPQAVHKLLRYLSTVQITAASGPGRYQLTELGELLAHEHYTELFDLGGLEHHLDLSVLDLAEVVGGATAEPCPITAQNGRGRRTLTSIEDSQAEQADRSASGVAPAVAASPLVQDVEHLVLHADAWGRYAHHLLEAVPQLDVTIMCPPEHTGTVRAQLPSLLSDTSRRARVRVHGDSPAEHPPIADAVLFAQVLTRQDDVQAAQALRQGAQSLPPSGRLLVVEQPLDETALIQVDAEADLRALTCHGSGRRTDAEYRELLTAAGLGEPAAHCLPWGYTVYELRKTPETLNTHHRSERTS